MHDYAIYGGGPTGLILAYIIALNGYKVILVEKESELGGCWRTEWLENKYFSEHSPRVLFPNDNNLIKILNNFGMDMKKELSQKSPSGTGITSVVKFMLARLSLLDMIKMVPLVIFKGSGNLTVTEWGNKNNLSESGKRALRTLSIVLANSPDKLLMSELFGDEAVVNSIFSFGNSYPTMSQFVNHDKWINVFHKKLISLNVTILTDSELIELAYHDNKITHGVLKGGKLIESNNHILTFPPVAFYNFMKAQNSIVKNNWMDIAKLKEWMLDSYYASIGFQLHFTEKQDFPEEWCWSCENDYDLIVVNVSKFTDQISKDPNIKSVLSCTVVATDNYVKKWGKTINELDLDVIINDCLKILKVDPYKITVYPGLHKKYGKYISQDTAFSLGKSGVIPFKGQIDNLYTVGPHNKPGITSIGKASKIAVEFCKFLKLVVPNYLQKKSFGNIFFIFFILLIFSIAIYYISFSK